CPIPARDWFSTPGKHVSRCGAPAPTHLTDAQPGVPIPVSTKASSAPLDVGSVVEGIVQWVEIESPTSDKAAVNRMIDRVQHDLAGLPVKLERTSGQGRFADILTARLNGAGQGPGILVLSHIDTVHPIGTLRSELPV